MTECGVKRKNNIGLHRRVSEIFRGAMIPEEVRRRDWAGNDKTGQSAFDARRHPVGVIAEPEGLIERIARQGIRQASFWLRARRVLHLYARRLFCRS